MDEHTLFKDMYPPLKKCSIYNQLCFIKFISYDIIAFLYITNRQWVQHIMISICMLIKIIQKYHTDFNGKLIILRSMSQPHAKIRDFWPKLVNFGILWDTAFISREAMEYLCLLSIKANISGLFETQMDLWVMSKRAKM